VDNQRISFSQLCDQWWEIDKINLHEVTVQKKENVIRKHILPYFKDAYVQDICDSDIANMVKSELDHGNLSTGGPLCQTSVRRQLDLLKKIFEYAIRKKYIVDNPAEGIRLKNAPSKVYAVYTHEEVRALIDVARPKWLGDMILLAYQTGMRRGEIYGLKWEDINFDKRYLHVRRSVSSYAPSNKFITEPKTASSKRIILLDDATLEMFKRRLVSKNSEWVFANQYGRLMSPWYNVKYFRAACVKADIPIRRFHDLRHTHISNLVKAGINLPLIKMRAGHSSLSTTMIYVHLDNDAQYQIVDILNSNPV